jgi:hypothetical protein
MVVMVMMMMMMTVMMMMMMMMTTTMTMNTVYKSTITIMATMQDYKVYMFSMYRICSYIIKIFTTK